MNREVALKFQRHPANGSLAVDRRHGLRAEGRALAAVGDPAVTPVFDIETYDREIDVGLQDVIDRYELPSRGRYIVLEWIRGETLENAWASGTPLSDRLAQVCSLGEALASLHANGLVHRDVKPTNAMVEPSGRVRLLDLGIARAGLVERVETMHEADHEETGQLHAGYAIGTPRYMAPEQVVGQAVDGRADQYALAACLHRAVYDRPPPRLSVLDRSSWRVDVADRRPGGELVPKRLLAVITRGLALAPEDRFASVEDFVVATRRAIRPRRARWTAGLVVAALALVIGVAAWVAPGSQPPHRGRLSRDPSSEPPFCDPFQAERVRSAWRDLDAARRMRRHGEFGRATGIIESVEARTRLQGPRRLYAAALLARAEIHELLAQEDALMRAYGAAFEAGEQARSGWVIAVSAGRMARWSATVEGDGEKASQWIGYGRAALDAIDAPRHCWAILTMAQAVLDNLAGDPDTARRSMETELSALSEASGGGEEPTDTMHRDEVRVMLHVSAANYAMFSGDLDRATHHLRPVGPLLERVPDASTTLRLTALLSAAVLDDRRGRFTDAIDRYEQAARVAAALPPVHHLRIHAAINWSAAVMQAGQPEHALAMCRDTIRRAEGQRLTERLSAQLHECIGVTSMRVGRARDAVTHLERARVAYGDVLGVPSSESVRVAVNLATAWAVLEDRERAEPAFRRALADIEITHGPEHYLMGDLACDYAQFSSLRPQTLERARRYWRRCIDILEPLRGADHSRVVRARARLAELPSASGGA